MKHRPGGPAYLRLLTRTAIVHFGYGAFWSVVLVALFKHRASIAEIVRKMNELDRLREGWSDKLPTVSADGRASAPAIRVETQPESPTSSSSEEAGPSLP